MMDAEYVRLSMLALADTIDVPFPHHAKAIRDECLKWSLQEGGGWTSAPAKMTEGRWNRLADVICSLAALPGPLLDIETRHLRFRALKAAEAPRAMARMLFGGRRAVGALELAVHIAQENSPPETA